MSRDSDETTRLVEGHRQAHGRVSGSLGDDDDIGEDIDDFIKGTLVDRSDRQLTSSARARQQDSSECTIPALCRFCHLWSTE
jgi:hypothetical protein